MAIPSPRAEPAGEGRSDTRPAAPDRPGVLSEDGSCHCQLPMLRPEMILVMIPVLSSKNSALALSQPPKSLSIVYWVLTAGNGLLGSLAPGTVDVDPVDDRPEAGLGVVGLALPR